MIHPDTVRAHFQEHNARIRRWLRYSFGAMYGHMLQEAIQTAECLAFENVLSCAYRGKIKTEEDLDHYVRRSLYWSVRHTYAGRQIHDKSRTADDSVWGDVWEKNEREPDDHLYLRDFEARDTDPGDAAAFRLDMQSLMARMGDRQRSIFVDLMIGTSTGEVAAKYGVSSGRISQFRTQFKAMIESFFSD